MVSGEVYYIPAICTFQRTTSLMENTKNQRQIIKIEDNIEDYETTHCTKIIEMVPNASNYQIKRAWKREMALHHSGSTR